MRPFGPSHARDRLPRAGLRSPAFRNARSIEHQPVARSRRRRPLDGHAAPRIRRGFLASRADIARCRRRCLAPSAALPPLGTRRPAARALVPKSRRARALVVSPVAAIRSPVAAVWRSVAEGFVPRWPRFLGQHRGRGASDARSSRDRGELAVKVQEPAGGLHAHAPRAPGGPERDPRAPARRCASSSVDELRALRLDRRRCCGRRGRRREAARRERTPSPSHREAHDVSLSNVLGPKARRALCR
jgi:hypothetical protein